MTNEQPPKLPLTSHNLTEDKLHILREHFPEVFTEGNFIDWDILRLTLGSNLESEDVKERFGLTWPGKRNCFQAIKSPTTATLLPDREASVDFDTTENLYIEGDNLEVLKLLQKSYLGKVKMIYIDPPYNTGNDFVYPDDYTESLKTYLEYTGQVDAQGRKFTNNSDTTGRFHSKWLNMMYPRLFLARNLLREDGVIFISIDDTEVAHLRKICDEIFGEENFVANVIWERAFSPKNDARYFSDSHDHILVYSKIKEQFTIGRLSRTDEANERYGNLDNDPRGAWMSGDLTVKTYNAAYDYPILTPSGKEIRPTEGRAWVVSRDKFEELKKDNRIWFGNSGDNVPRLKRFLSEVKEGMVPITLWKYDVVGHNQEGRQELKALFDDRGYFDGPKPVRLLQRILHISNVQNDDIILDFFSGSATTAHAVLALNAEDGGNRKFILVQLPEPTRKQKADGTWEETEASRAGFSTISEI
ncbi:site-specific DNA-methyltransferase [Leptospira levettii]|uniref:site-specific DNA-methyltransferase n=1 Tax=Leptospira levettii TaxID=2023178 RepID=UPI001092E1CF|nr:site-specific DNA-methyltransferase [Leptospira levettii]TGM75783.1 site-specific DNA-methyltransferase [Leptospira levettii]